MLSAERLTAAEHAFNKYAQFWTGRHPNFSMTRTKDCAMVLPPVAGLCRGPQAGDQRGVALFTPKSSIFVARRELRDECYAHCFLFACSVSTLPT